VLERSIEPVRLVPERKPGGVRWLAHLDPATAATYAAAVAPLVPAIEATLPTHVVANRVAEIRSRPPSIRLEAWASARVRFRALVAELAAEAGGALVADVHDFYGSVAPSVLGEALSGLGCELTAIRRAVESVRRLSAYGVRGLPIGPEPSAVLANAVLSSLDASLASAGFPHVRWVDDVLVFAQDAAGARAALRVLTRSLARLRLRPATHKTRVLADPRPLVEAPMPPTSGLGARSGRASG
jgi:hypothetical protein